MQKHKKEILIAILGYSLGLLTSKLFSFANFKRQKKEGIIDLIGNTPLIYLKSLSKLCGCEIYAKAEFLNPTGSSKDRTALSIIRQAIKDKKLGISNTLIYEGTSGSTGISLASIGNSFGFQTRLCLPDDLAEEKYNVLTILNAQFVKLKPVSIVDNQHFCRQAQELAIRDGQFLNINFVGGFYADQFNNSANWKIHYIETAEEIFKQTNGKLDAFVMSAGTGGMIAGVSKKLKEKKKSNLFQINKNNKAIKIILADPPGSSLANKVNYNVCFTSQEAEGYRQKHPFDTVVEGVGQNRLTKNFEAAQIDEAFTIEDEESLHMALFLAQNEGLLLGGSSAMNCVAVVKTARKYPKLKQIVTVLCDSGVKYFSKFYNLEYLNKNNIKFEPKENYIGENFNLDFVK